MKTMAIISKNNEYIGETFMPYHLFRMKQKPRWEKIKGDIVLSIKYGKSMLLAFNQYPTPYNNIHNALIVNALL